MPSQLSHLLIAKYCSNPDDCYQPSAHTANQDGDKAQDQSVANEASDKRRDLNKKAHDATVAFLLLYLGIGDAFAYSARIPIDVEVRSDIPVGSGLGSSSAYSVALCGALLKAYLASVENYIISNWAFNVDKYFHGKPSGVDNNIVSVGGYILFQNGKIKAHGVNQSSQTRVLLINTGVSRSTKALSEKVSQQIRDQPASINALFSIINEVTTQIWRKMCEPEFKPDQIEALLGTNQHYLKRLGVGHEKLKEIITMADQHNLRAKQTGAGGGGFAFVLYDQLKDSENIAKLSEALIASGFTVYDHLVGCEGLIVKITPDPLKTFGCY